MKFILTKWLVINYVLVIGLVVVGCNISGRNEFVGCWEDAKGSELTFLNNSRVKIRLFDLINTAKLEKNEIVEFPINICWEVIGKPVYDFCDWEVNGQPAILTQNCKSSFVVECTEPINLKDPSKMRWWGYRQIDAYYEPVDKDMARIYVIGKIGNQENKFTIARVTLFDSELLSLEVDGIGNSFFKIGRKFGKKK